MTNAQELPAPIVTLATDGILDPELAGSYLEIEVPTSDYLIPFAECTMRITGRTLQGTDVEWEYQDQLPGGHSGESLWFYCEKNIVEALRDGTAVFRYTIASSTSDEPVSSAALVLSIGEPATPGLLPPPEIADLVAGVVDSTLPRLLVTVPASGASLKDAKVTLTLRTEDSPLLLELSQLLKATPPMRAKDIVQETKQILDDLRATPFTFRGYPAAHDDMEVEASYEIVSPDGSTTSPSEATIFRIGTALGSAPLIDEADGDALDTGAFTGDAHITTEPSARVIAGLYYWAYVVSEVDGVETSYPVKLDGQVTQAEASGGLRIPLSRELLDILPDASTLRIQVSINLTGAQDPFDTVDFPEKTYTVTAAQSASWDLEDLVPAQITPIHVGGTLSFPLMDVYFEAARVAPATNIVSVEKFAYSSPGFYSGVVFYIGGPTGTATDNVIRITFKRTWGKVRFGVTSLDAPMVVTWYSTSGQTFTQTLPGGSPTVGHEAKCEMPGISSVVINPKDGIRMDCFEFHS